MTPEQIATVRQRLKTALAGSERHSATSLARAIGRRNDYIRDFLHGRKNSIGAAEVAIIEIELGLAQGKLLGLETAQPPRPMPRPAGGEAEPTGRSPIVRPPKAFNEGRKLPVYASAEGGGGTIVVSTDALEYVSRPYVVESVSDAYGILIVGESMVPAFEPGDVAWVNPRLPPMRDTDCVLYAVPEDDGDAKATIKRLLRWTDHAWSLRQWNPRNDFQLERADWQRCHRVVGKFSRR